MKQDTIPSIPRHLLPMREFKRNRRAGIKEAIAGMENAMLGCLFTPAYDELCEARDMLEAARKLCSVKNWGR